MSLGDAMMLGQQYEEKIAKAALVEAAKYIKENSEVGDVWYRYDDKRYASSDPWGDDDRWTFSTEIEITRYKVVRVTPKGVQLAGGRFTARRPRFVLHESYKRFACGTLDLALDSYLKRKAVQESIYMARAKKARDCAQMARNGRTKFANDPEKININVDKKELSWS